MKKEQTVITVKLSKDLLEQLKTACEQEETNVSALIRRLCIAYLQKQMSTAADGSSPYTQQPTRQILNENY